MKAMAENSPLQTFRLSASGPAPLLQAGAATGGIRIPGDILFLSHFQRGKKACYNMGSPQFFSHDIIEWLIDWLIDCRCWFLYTTWYLLIHLREMMDARGRSIDSRWRLKKLSRLQPASTSHMF